MNIKNISVYADNVSNIYNSSIIYKNLNDKIIQKRIAEKIMAPRCIVWVYVRRVSLH